MSASDEAAATRDEPVGAPCRLLDQPHWQTFADALLVRASLVEHARHDRPSDPLAGTRVSDDDVLRLAGELTGADDGAEVSQQVADLLNELVAIGETAFGAAVDAREPLGAIAGTAALTGNEAAVLAVAAAVELDPRRQKLVGYLNDDVTQPWLTPHSLRLLFDDDEAVLALGPGGGLRRACLLDVGTDRPWGSTHVRPHPTVMWWLVGDQSPDPELPPELEQLDAPGGGVDRLVVAAGPDRIRRLQAVVQAVHAQGFLLCPATLDERQLDALVRRASLSGEAILVEADAQLPAAVRARVERAFHLSWAVSSAHDLPVAELPRRPWRQLPVAPAAARDDEIVAVFGDDRPSAAALTASQLDAAAVALPSVGGQAADAVRRIAAGHIEQLATRIVPSRTWEDLVLEPTRLELVRSIVERARHRDVVYGEWGFSPLPSIGVTGLFAGPSGTGKTLSAEIVAGELGLDLYRIDLSQLVSKYIGETEKNLSEVFAAAEASPVVLFFDEADALLGKRSEVSDAHDRYANIEVAYLLQRLERYNGVVILATNLASNIDPAFMRRVHVAVEFPMPEPAERLRIWQRSIPPPAPVADVDLALFAEGFELSGGSISNAAAAAAFLAAAAGTPITMPVLAVAVKRELQKLARLVRPEDFGRWAEYVTAAD